MKTTIEKLVEQKRLDISFVQKGGLIERIRSECDEVGAKLVKDTEGFDDYRFLVRLPIPVNSMSQAAALALDTGVNDARLADGIFNHWVERVDAVRCQLFFECLSADEKSKLHQNILASFSPINVAYETKEHKWCFGQHAGICNNEYGRPHFSCGARSNIGQMVTDACIKDFGGFRSETRSVGDFEGNECGYALIDVTCFRHQPRFP